MREDDSGETRKERKRILVASAINHLCSDIEGASTEQRTAQEIVTPAASKQRLSQRGQQQRYLAGDFRFIKRCFNAVLLHATNHTHESLLSVRYLLLLRTATGHGGESEVPKSFAMAEVQQPMLQPHYQQQQHHHQSSAITMEIISRAATIHDSGSELWEAAARWVRWDPNATTRATVQGWIDNRDEDPARRWECLIQDQIKKLFFVT